MSMSVEIQRRLLETLKRNKREKGLAIRLLMHPTILARLKNEDANILRELEDQYGKDLSFRADPTIHIEQFKLLDPETNAETALKTANSLFVQEGRKAFLNAWGEVPHALPKTRLKYLGSSKPTAAPMRLA
jgi:hypothetical protein